MIVNSESEMKFVNHNFTNVKHKLLNKHSNAENHFKDLLTKANIYFVREKCNYKKNAGISKNISIFLKFSPKITILYKVSPKQSNYDRERKEESKN